MFEGWSRNVVYIWMSITVCCDNLHKTILLAKFEWNIFHCDADHGVEMQIFTTNLAHIVHCVLCIIVYGYMRELFFRHLTSTVSGKGIHRRAELLKYYLIHNVSRP